MGISRAAAGSFPLRLLDDYLVNGPFTHFPREVDISTTYSFAETMPGVCHWGPLTALGIVLTVTVTATYSALQLWALPRVR